MMTEMIKQALSKYKEQHGKSLSPRTILFDMDGVLYDSMPAHERSWLETAQAYGLPMNTHDVYMFEGQTGGQTIDILMHRCYNRPATEQERKDIYTLKTELFNKYNTGALIPHIQDAIALTEGLNRIIVTGSSQAGLLDKLNDNFPGVFVRERMVTGMDVVHGKPHPEPYLKGMALAQTKTYQSIVVENAPSGVRSASTAGCFTIAVNTGPLPDEALWQEGAHLVLPNMRALQQCLSVLLNR